jgi:hypothetical protein
MSKKFTAQDLYDFLHDLKTEFAYDLSTLNVNFRENTDSDVCAVNYVFEDLYDSETNSVLTSIMLFDSIEDSLYEEEN